METKFPQMTLEEAIGYVASDELIEASFNGFLSKVYPSAGVYMHKLTIYTIPCR